MQTAPNPAGPDAGVPARAGQTRRHWPMLLIAVRAIFLLIIAGLAGHMARLAEPREKAHPIVIFLAVFAAAIVVVAVDLATPRKRVQSVSAVYFGVTIGLILGYFLNLALE